MLSGKLAMRREPVIKVEGGNSEKEKGGKVHISRTDKTKKRDPR